MTKYIEADKYLNYLHSKEADFLDDYGKGWVAGICTAQRIAKHFLVNMDEQKNAYWQWFDEPVGSPTESNDRDWGWKCSNCFYILPDDYDDPDCSENEYYKIFIEYSDHLMTPFFPDAGRFIGKTVFFTREEAEKALEAMKDG